MDVFENSAIVMQSTTEVWVKGKWKQRHTVCGVNNGDASYTH